LPDEILEEIAAHLEQCNRCHEAVKELDHEADPIVDSLRGLPQLGERPEASPALLPLPYRLGDYEVLSELGRGSMGIVYLARHTRLQRVVALKMLLAGEFAREDIRVRFNLEAKAVAQLQHPNIVQIFEVGEWQVSPMGPPVPYFTLEYVEGGSLSAHLARTPQPVEKAAQWVLALARGVHHAHEHGIVHRDLKPANVLLTSEGILKICDFGVAKVVTASTGETLGGLLIGTPEFMAPEQAEGDGRRAQATSDVYALGAILYAMLTGRPVFQGASVLETLELVRRREPTSPRRLRTAIPRDLETICLKCLEKDPRRRYSTAAALADDLDRYLNGQTLLARPAGTVERGWKWARRRPAIVLMSLAMVGLTVASFVLIVWQWQRAETKALAEAAAKDAAQQHRFEAVQSQAQLALDHGLSLCERGEVSHGLSWLSRSKALSEGVGLHDLERAIRINLADWTGQLIRTVWTSDQRAPILDLAISPDGRQIVSVGKDRHIHTWDAETGREIGKPFTVEDLADGEWIGRVAFSPRDSQTMLSGDNAGHARFWDLKGRRPGAGILDHPSTHMIWGIAFTPDGRKVVTACDDGLARWWDVATGKSIGKPLRHAWEQGFYTLALSPDGKTLATGGNDRRVVRWDVATGSQIGKPLLFDSRVHMLSYLRDGQRLVMGTRDGGLRVWNPESEQVFELPSQGTSVMSLAVAPDGKMFATGTANGILRLWDTRSLRQVGATGEFAVAVTGLMFHPSVRSLVVGLDDGAIRLVVPPTAKAVGPVLTPGGAVNALFYSDDGTRLLTGSGSGAQWWNVATGLPIGPRMHCSRYETSKKFESADGRRQFDVADLIEATAFSPDRSMIATAGEFGHEERIRGRAEIWSAQSGERLRQTPEQPLPLVGAVFSPDSRSLLTWDASPRSAILWDTATLKSGRPMLRTLGARIRRAAFADRDGTLLVACQDGTARIWDINSDEEIRQALPLRHGYPVTATAFDPVGSLAATGCQGGIVCLWTVESRNLLREIPGNAGTVDAVAFSSDGKTLLTGSHDGTARFWDVASGRQLGRTLYHTDAVLSVAFHPDGNRVATGTKNGIAQQWIVPAGQSPESGHGEPAIEKTREQVPSDANDSRSPWLAGPLGPDLPAPKPAGPGSGR
jgi:WD40 repeat protein